MIVKTDNQNYKDIANAIREKTGTEQTYFPNEMAEAIRNIPIEDGGYYSPNIAQTEPGTANFSWTASKDGMPDIPSVQLTLPKGQDGNQGDPGAAAGFGTVTATATKLDSGAQPTVQAEWSGPDTAKNLTLTFGIPEGPQGPAYTLTPEDKSSIVQDVLAALPNAEGVGF